MKWIFLFGKSAGIYIIGTRFILECLCFKVGFAFREAFVGEVAFEVDLSSLSESPELGKGRLDQEMSLPGSWDSKRGGVLFICGSLSGAD